jgi:hypothetical protein
MDHEDRTPRSVNCARTKNLNGEMTMTTEVKMSPQAEQAFTRILALRAATRETGTVTKNTQSLILRQLSPQDLSDVTLALSADRPVDPLSGGIR